MWAYRAATACTVAILKLELICLENCVYTSIYFYWNKDYSVSVIHGVKRHECVDEVTVNRDKPPLLLWEQARPLTPDLTAEALYGWLSRQLCGPPDHKHSPWAGWTVMDGNPWAARSSESAPYGVNQLTSHWCVYVDVHVWMCLSYSRGDSFMFK